MSLSPRPAWRWLLGALFALPTLGGCEAPKEPAPAAEIPDPMPALRAFEAERRKAADFASMPPSDARLGADPYAIEALPGGERFVALLRGRDVIVVLDAAMRERARLSAPGSPTGLALTPDGKYALVVGEREGAIRRYQILAEPPYLAPAGRYALEGARALRDVAVGPEGVVYAVEERGGRLLTLWPESPAKDGPDEVLPARIEEAALGAGPIRVERVGKFVVAACVLDHAIVIRPVDAAGRALEAGEARITHDGPIWSFSAEAEGEGLFVVAGGVEDHPLDRRGGFFGYIDSFVTTYRVSAGKSERIGALNVSDLGVVTPKAMRIARREGGAREVLVTGYGGESRAQIQLDAAGAPTLEGVRVAPLVAGTRALVALPGGGFVAANPLLDAFVVLHGEAGSAEIVPASDPAPASPRSAASRLGEALFFTTLMAPDNTTEGAHSRFTCETCHFEGYGDGRIHHTGRGEIRVVTKPLVGLFNNRPHFSRALDPDLSSVAHNEFRVAGAGNEGRSPWFVLEAKSHPTLAALEGEASAEEPLDLRRALMSFLMDFSHRSSPSASGRTTFTALEREGAERFFARCESCHEARLSTDEPSTRVPFERWESLVFAPQGAIVWANHEYRKTGVTPYVHESGARVPSLRRLYKKHPYLTSGAAKTIDDLLSRARWSPSPSPSQSPSQSPSGAFFHDGAPQNEELVSLDAHEREAIAAFLGLL